MDYKNFRSPFIDYKLIKEKADAFRKKYCGNIIPVDIEKTIEKIGIDIIPIPNLERLCNTDAFIASDWKSIQVDNEKYMDDRYYNRLRFSLAHELGHLLLHKLLYASLAILNLEDYYRFLSEVSGIEYSKIETQANKFAGFLLIPREILKIERSNILKKYYDELKSIDAKQVNSYIAGQLAKKFGVSPEAMEIALNNEN